MNNTILLLYPRTNRHLGLWKDLDTDPRVIMRCTDFKPKSKLMIFIRRCFLFLQRRGIRMPLHRFWYQYDDLYKIIPKASQLVIIDGSLNQVEIDEIKHCRRINPNLKVCLYLINSIHAKSPILRGVREKIELFKWDKIYTFDASDAKEFGFEYAGFMYYSKHTLPIIKKPQFDAHFVGGLKGNRTQMICDTYNYLISCGVKCDFNLMHSSDEETTVLQGVNYYRGWKPYEEMLAKVADTKCIIEITQEGQNGATLRYFEAVCHNKKLLTNNSAIVDFPYYNSKYMRIFSSPEDIDVEWIKEEADVDYGYQGDFSPTHFIDFITKKKYE